MGKVKTIDFTKYEWHANPPSGIGYLFYFFSRGMQSFLNLLWLTNVIPPFGYQIPGFFTLATSKSLEITNKTWLIEIGKSIGIDSEDTHANLRYHWRRIQNYNRIGMLTSPLLVLVVSLLVIEISNWLFFGIFYSLALSTGKIYYPGLITITLIFMWIVIQTSKRLLASILNRYYADTLTVVGTLYFMIELLRQDALAMPQNRHLLQNRIHQLGQNILLLPLQFKSESLEEHQWISSHFKSMDRFVREHERLIVAPKADSLDVLRQDFYNLLKILFSGNYGEFKYEYQPSALIEPTKTNRVAAGVLGFIGFMIPILILYILYVNPQRVANMGVDINTLTLVALAWFLLTIDASLKLGIVERIIGLAKTIRELR